jgi:hypothetical protein
MTETVTSQLKGVEIRRWGDLIDLGILSKEYVVVTELTVEQALNLAELLVEAANDDTA